MEKMIHFFEQRLQSSGLVEQETVLLAVRDDMLFWNKKDDPLYPALSVLLENSSAAALLFARPAQPYKTMLEFLCQTNSEAIYPRDCETRTFFHSFPIVREATAESIARALKKGKGAVIQKEGIVTLGAMTLEQAYIAFSSICFACFVKFYSDYLSTKKHGVLTDAFVRAFHQARDLTPVYTDRAPVLTMGRFEKEETVYNAIIEAGKATVELGLVDSFFGNISCLRDNTIYISQTGASMDYLSGCIDPCKPDHSSCAGITASSEFSAHRAIYSTTDTYGILHGHPRFSVVLSMVCDKPGCPHRDECHIRCPEKRRIKDIPIVPGEVGTGPFGLCNTVPAALDGHRGVIVHGHGVFTCARKDFNEALDSLLTIERMCRTEFFNQADS